MEQFPNFFALENYLGIFITFRCLALTPRHLIQFVWVLTWESGVFKAPQVTVMNTTVWEALLWSFYSS